MFNFLSNPLETFKSFVYDFQVVQLYVNNENKSQGTFSDGVTFSGNSNLNHIVLSNPEDTLSFQIFNFAN
jgi:hypothetical protein